MIFIKGKVQVYFPLFMYYWENCYLCSLFDYI